MIFNEEMKQKLNLISNVPEDKLIEEKLVIGKLGETYVDPVKELVESAGNFMPRVLESFGMPTALTKRVRALSKEEKLTNELIVESNFTVKDIILMSNALEKIVETTPNDVIESSNKSDSDTNDNAESDDETTPEKNPPNNHGNNHGNNNNHRKNR